MEVPGMGISGTSGPGPRPGDPSVRPISLCWEWEFLDRAFPILLLRAQHRSPRCAQTLWLKSHGSIDAFTFQVHDALA